MLEQVRLEQFAPWINDPDDPADGHTDDDFATRLAAAYPDLVDKGELEHFAPWIIDPDDPADGSTDDDFATRLAAAYPDLVDKSNDGPLKDFREALRRLSAEEWRDPYTQEIIIAFMEAVNHIDASEPAIRDLIEGDLMDVAGINRTKVSDAIITGNRLAEKIAAIREKHIKRAFRHLRDKLPND